MKDCAVTRTTDAPLSNTATVVSRWTENDWIIAEWSDGKVTVSVPVDKVQRVKLDSQNRVVEDRS